VLTSIDETPALVNTATLAMPRYWPTKSMVSVESHPFSSCAMISAAMTADCFCPAGYFATSRSIFLSDSAESMRA
jgi:hypothetical protein